MISDFADAVTNIRETVKWIIASLGAVLAVLLGGIQFAGLGISNPMSVSGLVWIALAAAFAVVMLSLWLAVRVLVSEGVWASELFVQPRYKRERDYINKQWRESYPDIKDAIGDMRREHIKFAKELDTGTITASDQKYEAHLERLKTLTATASWLITLRRFKDLRNAILVLVPIAALAAAVIASHEKGAKGGGTTLVLDSPIGVMDALTPTPVHGPLGITLKLGERERKMLASAGRKPGCLGNELKVLVLEETAGGISEAVTFPNGACPLTRLLLLDRAQLLKVLE